MQKATGGERSAWTKEEAIITLHFLLKHTPSAIETKQQMKTIESNFSELVTELQNINRRPRKESAIHALYVNYMCSFSHCFFLSVFVV